MRDVFKSKFKVRKLCVSICAEPVFVNCGGGTFLCRQIIIAREREREREREIKREATVSYMSAF